MNVYDFDGTIYRGDSTVDFFLFCMKKKPVLVFHFLKQLFYYFLYILKINSLSNIDERIKELEQKKEELEEQRKEFESLLENFSTYEAADRYRLACIYENKCLKMAIDYKAMLTFMRKYGDILSGNTDSNIILNEKKRDIVNEKKEDIVKGLYEIEANRKEVFRQKGLSDTFTKNE